MRLTPDLIPPSPLLPPLSVRDADQGSSLTGSVMVENRTATALVIACVLSVLATAYLSVGVASRHWYYYSSPPARGEANLSEARALYEEFMDGEFDEKTYSDTLFRLNGTLGLWWRCVLVPDSALWYRDTGG